MPERVAADRAPREIPYWVSMRLDPGRPENQLFADQPGRRVSKALGVSGFLHAAAVAGVFLLVAWLPEPAPLDLRRASSDEIPRERIVWLNEPGPGGGGGGGGNRSIEPPRLAEAPGKDRLTVPVAKPPEIVPVPSPEDEMPKPELNIPAKAMESSDQLLAGVLDGMKSSNSPTSQGPGSGGGSGTGVGTGIGSGTGSGLGPGSGGGTGGRYYRPGSGIELPRLLREVKPQYTTDAMRAKIQGTAVLDCVVGTDGSVRECDVVRSLDSSFGLDQEALKAARQWRFVPGKRFGQPVPVLVTIELTFTLR
ncbi:MAG TPA: energy transducer TonB [Vicinamibacterales bacterium]|nr:energy transducer TonB [Vicinamibacterales bacterium]